LTKLGFDVSCKWNKSKHMYRTTGRFCYLEELTIENEKLLYELLKNNKEEYSYLVSDSPLPEEFKDFQLLIKRWFENGRSFQFIVKDKKSNVSGTIFFYCHHTNSDSIKLSCFFEENKRNSLIVCESLGLALLFAYKVLNINKIIIDIYTENEKMISFCKKLKWKKIDFKDSNINKKRKIFVYEIDQIQIINIVQKILKLENKACKTL
jgi:RimJ/RimL family protein N-acetyltransferase